MTHDMVRSVDYKTLLIARDMIILYTPIKKNADHFRVKLTDF